MSKSNKVLSRPYQSRMDFIKRECRGKSVLHLGCGYARSIADHLARGDFLHAILWKEAKELYGVDIDREGLAIMQKELGFHNLLQGDVERLSELELNKTFDIVVAGNLLEHLTCPGAMLEGVKKFLPPNGKIIASTVNAFGLHFQLRRWMGRYVEHEEHCCFYSPETLFNLFSRHGYHVEAIYGAYTAPPWNLRQKLQFFMGNYLFKLFPILSGTLIISANKI